MLLIYSIGNIKWVSDSKVKEKGQNLRCKFEGYLHISDIWYIESALDHHEVVSRQRKQVVQRLSCGLFNVKTSEIRKKSLEQTDKE